MILKSIALAVCECMECGYLMVYEPAKEFPSVCQKCGCPKNVTLNQEERMRMERMQQQRQQNSRGGNGGQTFTVRMG